MDSILNYFTVSKDILTKAAIDIVIALIVILIATKLIDFLFNRLKVRLKKEGNMDLLNSLSFFRYILIVIVYFFCIASVVSQIPQLKTMMTSLLAGSGIAALIIGFASQEAVGNIVCGILITIFKPFKIGDTVRFIDRDIVGTVEEVALRHTVIRTFENKCVIIPNGTINKEIIENFNYADNTLCVFIDVGITYESDVELAMRLMAKVVREHPDYYDRRTPDEISNGAPEVLVRVIKFDSSAVILRAWVWARDSATAYAMQSDLMLTIKRVFEENGVEIARPHCTVVMKKPKE